MQREQPNKKIFKGRSKALKISILFKMMNFICIKLHCYNCILYFDCLWKQVRKTKRLYKYLKIAQELRKLVIVAKKKLMNFPSSLLARNKIHLDVTKKSPQAPVRNSCFRGRSRIFIFNWASFKYLYRRLVFCTCFHKQSKYKKQL